MRPGERRTREVKQGGGSQGGIMELKSTDGGCLLTGGAAVIFIITRIPRRPSHNTTTVYWEQPAPAPRPARRCEQEMGL